MKRRFLHYFLLISFTLFSLFCFAQTSSVVYIDRQTKQMESEIVAGLSWIKWLYQNPLGELSLDLLVKRKFVSEFYGKQMDKPSSVSKIEPFIKELQIDMSVYPQQDYSSFNQFFARKINPSARPIDKRSDVFVSPADGKILAFETLRGSFFVKGIKFDVARFVQNNTLANSFVDGSLAIIRLAPPDYHRFHFPASGRLSALVKIGGAYFSVSPIALSAIADIYLQNKREYLIISTELFGDVIMAEVGATMVGSIIQTYTTQTATKGQEKGYFKFGGSSVVLIFQRGKINFDSDLLENTLDGYETKILMGERIGITTSKKDGF